MKPSRRTTGKQYALLNIARKVLFAYAAAYAIIWLCSGLFSLLQLLSHSGLGESPLLALGIFLAGFLPCVLLVVLAESIRVMLDIQENTSQSMPASKPIATPTRPSNGRGEFSINL